jgi:hypothetical protein
MDWFRRFGNIIVAKMIELLFDGPSLTDRGCTLRLISRSARDMLVRRLTVKGSHFLPEVVILALLSRLRVIEIPINYRGRIGTSKITGTTKATFKTGFRMIGLIFTLRFRSPRFSLFPRMSHCLEPRRGLFDELRSLPAFCTMPGRQAPALSESFSNTQVLVGKE